MNAPPPPSHECPQCRSPLVRVPRLFSDRVIDLFVPVMRCRCAAGVCGWQGLVRRSGRGFYAERPVLEPSRGHRAADAPQPLI